MPQWDGDKWEYAASQFNPEKMPPGTTIIDWMNMLGQDGWEIYESQPGNIVLMKRKHVQLVKLYH